jgi:hypothetical protein
VANANSVKITITTQKLATVSNAPAQKPE